MKQAVAGIAGIVLALSAAPTVDAAWWNRNTAEERAKEDLKQQQAEAERTEQRLRDEMNQKKAEISRDAKEKARDIKHDTERRIDALQSKTEEQREEIQTNLERAEQHTEQQLDAARAREAQERADREAELRQEREQAQQAQVKTDEISGTVTALDPASRTLAIREDLPGPFAQPTPTNVQLDKDIAVMEGGKRLSLHDIQVGDRVRLQLRDHAGQRTVQAIEIAQRMSPGR